MCSEITGWAPRITRVKAQSTVPNTPNCTVCGWQEIPVSPLATFQLRPQLRKDWEAGWGWQRCRDHKDLNFTRRHLRPFKLPNSSLHLQKYFVYYILLRKFKTIPSQPPEWDLCYNNRTMFLVRLSPSYPGWPWTLGSSNPLASASRVARTPH